jgi:hypothetical protein
MLPTLDLIDRHIDFDQCKFYVVWATLADIFFESVAFEVDNLVISLYTVATFTG